MVQPTPTIPSADKQAAAPGSELAAIPDTPAMRQYKQFKASHPGCVLFFRMGDFYEMFFEDAKLAHRVMGVSLTQRTQGIPMAGVPYHAVEGYLRRMIQAGHRVAVCEQIENPAEAKGVVKRDITRVITPGTLTDESLLADEQVSPCAAVVFHGGGKASVAWAELSTGSFELATFDRDAVGDELSRINPSELLFCESADGDVPPRVGSLPLRCPRTGRPSWQFRPREALDALLRQYRVASLAGFGLADDDEALPAAGALLHYLLETQRSDDGCLPHLRPPKRFTRTEHLVIDQATLSSLEVEKTLRGDNDEGSLLNILRGGGTTNGCVTAMGKRRLREWLCYPLANRAAIEERQRVVQAFVDDARFRDELGEALDGVHDVPRIMARLAVGRATPRDVVGLGRSLGRAGALEKALSQRPSVAPYHARLASVLDALSALAQRIVSACVESPPAHLRGGGLFRDGTDTHLDEYRGLQRDSNTWLAGYQKQLVETVGVASLKVGYNKVFGYYIEVSAANRDKINESADYFRGWMRKQTLKNAERFITPELKDFEGKVLSAEGRAVAREQHLFEQLCGACAKEIDALHRYADLVADLDVLLCFGKRAARHRYVKPVIVDEPVLHIVAGRHPVLDVVLGDRFVPNDVFLGGNREQGTGNSQDNQPKASSEAHCSLRTVPSTLALITGPNMAGKSTYIRMTALIALLAHTGSFVPADAATVGLCDRIFTRVGAHDELHAGRSTFMVEMTETANICHHATAKSLVILDEIGRGTSTLDGLSLAWAIAEYLASVRCRCLFATHYHELTTLAEPAGSGNGVDSAGRYRNVTNLNVSVREWNDQIVFLHRIVPGATDRSYGIHVAKIAGLPDAVVRRANALLGELAVSHEGRAPMADAAARSRGGKPPPAAQLPLFTEYVAHPAVDALRELDVNALTPLAAFDLVRSLCEQVRGDAK